jgi:hypothetical protein
VACALLFLIDVAKVCLAYETVVFSVADVQLLLLVVVPAIASVPALMAFFPLLKSIQLLAFLLYWRSPAGIPALIL